MSPAAESNRSRWRGQAAKVARQVNTAWWLETLAMPLLVLGLVGACALLFLRRESPQTSHALLAAATGGAVALAAASAWLVARRRFETPEQSMVRIEASMRLRNRLSAALAGVAPWPEALARVDAGLRWNWPRLVLPPLASLAFLAAGLLIPVSALPAPKRPPQEPLAWTKLKSDLDVFEKDQLADESYIEEMRKRLEELQAQDKEDWFSHSSLEATDNLRKSHAAEMERVERELTRAERALGGLEKNAPGTSEAEHNRLLNEFEQALDGLQHGAMKPNHKLLEQLKGLDPSKLGQLDPQQLEQLRENLRQKAEDLGKCQAPGQGDEEWLDELLDGQNGKDGNGDGQGNDKDAPEGEGPGQGGVNRGPGTTPDVLGREHDHLDTGDLTPMESKDLSRALPGDLLQLQDGKHQIDQTPTRPSTGGHIESTGQGGDRVWKEALDPDEQRALKRFFE